MTRKAEIAEADPIAPRILLVDDDLGLQRQMKWALKPSAVEVSGTRAQALERFRKIEGLDIVILDLGLPPDVTGASEGLKTLDSLLSERPQTKVIILSGHSDRAVAVDAVSRGAFDFVSKPVEIDVLRFVVQRAQRMHELELENRLLRDRIGQRLPGLVFASPQMEQIVQTVERVAKADVSVLVLGESGTGKELIARALHESSTRSNAKFLAMNCASIPDNLLESELFGHERGAFTGAIKQTIGKLEQAQRGTLFLDEIADMSLPLQAKLLRFLQGREFERVGGRQTISVDVRVISATNQPLTELVQQGKFREDLFYRLNEIQIKLPPLREREGDSVLLAQHFLNLYNRAFSRNIRGFANDALTGLGSYSWPGNVRELESRIKRAVIMADGKVITAANLELDASKPRNLDLRRHVDQLEQSLLREAMSVSNGNISKTAKLLGISRPQVYSLLSATKKEPLQ